MTKKRQEAVQTELTISDDFMFGKAMGDKVASRSGWICIRGIKSVCTMQRCRI